MHSQGNQSFKKNPAFSFKKISSSPKTFSFRNEGGRQVDSYEAAFH